MFNYFVGRSHPLNLLASIWPVYFLLAVFTQKLYKRIAPVVHSSCFSWKVKIQLAAKYSFQSILFFGLFYFLGSSLVSIGNNIPSYVEIIRERIAVVLKGTPPDFLQEVEFIQSTSKPDDPVFIISDYAPELYLYTLHRPPINVPSFDEIFLYTDVNKMVDFLRNPPQNAKIYWDQRFYDNQSYVNDINPTNFPNLKARGASPDKNIVLFTP